MNLKSQKFLIIDNIGSSKYKLCNREYKINLYVRFHGSFVKHGKNLSIYHTLPKFKNGS